jgi:hypothetical protein
MTRPGQKPGCQIGGCASRMSGDHAAGPLIGTRRRTATRPIDEQEKWRPRWWCTAEGNAALYVISASASQALTGDREE